MQWQIAVRGLRRTYFDLARSLIDDCHNTCRWQAMIVIGEYIETDPARVWPIVEHYGQSDDEDMRAAVATVLLEHALGYHRRQHE